MNYLIKAPLFVMSCRFQVRSEYITQEVKANCYHLKQHHLKLKPFGVLLSMDIVVSVMTLFIETMISIGNNTVWSSVNSVGPVIFTIFISVNLWHTVRKWIYIGHKLPRTFESSLSIYDINAYRKCFEKLIWTKKKKSCSSTGNWTPTLSGQDWSGQN